MKTFDSYVKGVYIPYDIQNLAFVFISATKRELCSVTGRVRLSMSEIHCVTMTVGNILQNYFKTYKFSSFWHYINGISISDDLSHEIIHGTIPSTTHLNPFDYTASFDIYLYVAQIITAKSNSSLTNSEDIFPTITSETVHFDASSKNVLTKASTFNFLSCYEEKYISFGFYLIPFMPQLWYALLIFLGVKIAILMAFKWIYLRSEVISYSSMWLLLVAMLLDDSAPVPQKLENTQFYRLILSVWGPVAVLLTNCYSSLMISDLNAPLSGATPESFEDLVCEKSSLVGRSEYYVNVTKMELTTMQQNLNKPRVISDSFFDPGCFRLLMVQDYNDERISRFYFALEYIKDDLENLARMGVTQIRREQLIQFLLLSDKHATLPRRMISLIQKMGYGAMPMYQKYVEEEISLCEKSVLAGENYQIDTEFEYYGGKYPWKKFYKGKDSLRPSVRVWSFEGGGRGSKVPRNFEALFESGIYAKLENQLARRIYAKRGRRSLNGEELDKPMSVYGGIVTLFMVTGVIVSMGGVLFVIENYGVMCDFWYKYFAGLNLTAKICSFKGKVLRNKFSNQFRRVWDKVCPS